MKACLLLCAVSALMAAAIAIEMAPLHAMDSPTIVKGEYIVVLDEKVSEKEMADHISVVKGLMGHYPGNTSEIMFEYNIGDFHGYSVRMTDKVRDMVRSMGKVKYVEANQIMTTQQDKCTLQEGATWGIVRTTERDTTAKNVYSYHDDGGGVDIYIIDTGIYTQHPDFGGRAKWGIDYIDSPSPQTDLNGHGTHCAGTVMSNTWGLAKKGTAIAVRVLNANGSGTTSGVISGVNWVADQHTTGKKSVANMSLGGGYSTTLNRAVNNAVTAGVHFAVAAGNEAQSACNVSPASAENPVTVGASDSSDQFAYFSNYGTCMDIIGPGVSVTSTWLNGRTNTISGTSMAAPHIAGVMAKYLTNNDYTTAQLKSLLIEKASKNKISGLPSSTVNELVFKDCE